MTLVAHWSKYAIQQALRAAMSDSPVDYTGYTARLYSNNANPDSGPTPVELTVAGYVPVASVAWTRNYTTLVAVNTDEWDFTGMSSAVVEGLAVTDDGTGDILWYCTSFTGFTTISGGGVIIPATDFQVSMVGV